MAEDPADDVRPLARISMSLPEDLLTGLDRLVSERGFPSRSHAVALLLSQYIVDSNSAFGDDIFCGTITLLYYNNMFDLQTRLAEMQYEHIDEVIASMHVQLVKNQIMEVILVQGPGRKIEEIASKMTKLRGVLYGKLQLVGATIPPLHPVIPKPE